MRPSQRILRSTRTRVPCLLFGILLGSSSCSSDDVSSAETDRGGGTLDVPPPPSEPELAPAKPLPEPAKLILVSTDRRLHSFDPRIPGLAAYHEIGKLDCTSRGNPAALAVDRSGVAWVLYDTTELFRVSIADASCEPTKYRHPSFDYLVGMSFTSNGPGSQAEQLYVLSPTFGLGTVGFPDLLVSKTEHLARHGGDLAGGADGRLFVLEWPRAELSEVDRSSFALRPLHRFEKVGPMQAFAVARLGGKFHIFTSERQSAPSKTIIYDPERNTETVRDRNIGFEVVGASPLMTAPPSDAGSNMAGDVPGIESTKPPASAPQVRK